MNAELAKTIWEYDATTGNLVWKVSSGNGIYAGDKAGTITSSGYRAVAYLRKKHFVHRLAWLIITGEWPPINIDHVDGNGLNNEWSNLRLATQSQNLCNTRTRTDNDLGLKGVCRGHKGKFNAYICMKGKRKNLGTFSTAQEAKAAYDAAAQQWHGKFARAA